jgi:hypothetical protein
MSIWLRRGVSFGLIPWTCVYCGVTNYTGRAVWSDVKRRLQCAACDLMQPYDPAQDPDMRHREVPDAPVPPGRE